MILHHKINNNQNSMHMSSLLILPAAVPLFNTQFISCVLYFLSFKTNFQYCLIFFNRVGALQVGILNPPH
jgi:hypothetical protein